MDEVLGRIPIPGFEDFLHLKTKQHVEGKIIVNPSQPPTFQCTRSSVPMVFIVFSRDSWGL